MITISFSARLPLKIRAEIILLTLVDQLRHLFGGCSSLFLKVFEYLGLSPEIFSVLLGPGRLWYESLSVLLSLLEEGADTEMV